MSDRPDPRLGTTLGPYRIEAVLGRGGMGVVYLAEQRELGRKVALKLLPDELAADADFRARFERESRLAAAIDHPNIIPLYEAGEIDGTLFLAMRYVDGTDLATRLRDGPMTSATAIEVLTQVAGALDAAHARGLVHRDVKPGNVLLDASAGEGREHAYLTDFGLTKQSGSESGLTRAGAFLGTPAYMAPEQIEGGDVDGRADQYSLACMAFECLTGEVPFRREKEIAVAMAHLREAAPSAVAVRPDLPAGVDAVLAQGMAKDREARYASCDAFATDLRAALGGEAIAARLIRDTRRRTPLLVAVLGLGLVAVAGLTLASGLGGLGSDGASPSGSVAQATAPGADTSPTPTSTAFPTEIETELLALLPTDLVAGCERGSYQEVSGDEMGGTPIASLTCTRPRGPGPELVLVRRFPSLGLGAGQSGFTTESAVSYIAARNQLRSGDCTKSDRKNGRWELSGEDAGAMACWTSSTTGEATLYWSYKDLSILVKAVDQDGDAAALREFFSQTARFLVH